MPIVRGDTDPPNCPGPGEPLKAMSGTKKEYAIIGFQRELLTMIVNTWCKKTLGIDVQDMLGEEELRAVLDDKFCKEVGLKFRQHWTSPTTADADRKEKFAKLLVEIDEMVEEAFTQSEDLHERFKERCREAGYDLDDLVAQEYPPLAQGASR